MNYNKNFKAHIWFKETVGLAEFSSKSPKEYLAKNSDGASENNLLADADWEFKVKNGNKNKHGQFSAKNFLIPDWQGLGLLSKEAIKIKKIHHLFLEDAKNKYQSFKTQNQSLRQTVFREFISFVEQKYGEYHHFTSPHLFWQEVGNPDSEYLKILSEFEDCYCFRAVTIYMLKVRFLLKIYQKMKKNFGVQDLIFLAHSFAEIFPKGSSHELMSQALQTNQYSWYRPCEKYTNELLCLKDSLSTLSITEINKIFDYEKEDYSHALSHNAWGLLLSEILVTFPNWIKEKKINNLSLTPPKALKTKFTGDYLSSLAGSFWLSQAQNSTLKWNEMLCPDFVGHHFKNGDYFKIFNELMFLSFTIDLAEAQNFDCISFLCQVIRELHQNSRVNEFGQTNFLASMERPAIHYDRIFLNLISVPKKNPHHYLLGRITGEIANLSSSGLLFVATNQNLFVPSHSEKLETFLKGIKLLAIFSFDDLKGKGEIGDYLYVFQKITIDRFLLSEQNHFNKNSHDPNAKMSCLSFKFRGQLEQFSKFQNFIACFKNFLQDKRAETTPLFQIDLGAVSFEFHQDAIIKGKLLSLLPTQKNKITHPHFFKNLTKNCLSFEEFFHVELIDDDNDGRTSPPLLAPFNFKLSDDERFPVVLIVNFSNPLNVALEIIPGKGLKAKKQLYGTADYQYLGLTFKKKDININLFRDYFNSELGNQIVQMSFFGGRAKTKAKANALLIPRFFNQIVYLPKNIDQYIKLVHLKEDQILSTHPTELRTEYHNLLKVLQEYSSDYPWHLLGHLSNTKFHLLNALLKIDGMNGSTNYNNPLVLGPLLKAPTINIFPDNGEVYSHFEIEDPNDINLPLTKVTMHLYPEDSNNLENSAEVSHLELQSENNVRILIYTSPEQIKFAHFVLNQAIHTPLADIIQNFKIPTCASLTEITDSFSQMVAALKEIHDDIEKRIYELLNQKISRSQ